jgi:hypothetical protein
MFRRLLSFLSDPEGPSKEKDKESPRPAEDRGAGFTSERWDKHTIWFNVSGPEFHWLCKLDWPEMSFEEAFQLYMHLSTAGQLDKFEEEQRMKLANTPPDSVECHPAGKAILDACRSFEGILSGMPGKQAFDDLMCRKCGRDYNILVKPEAFASAIDPADRAKLFDVLAHLYRAGAWTPQLRDARTRSEKPFGQFCMKVLDWLMEDGFPGAAIRAERIFELLAEGAQGRNITGFKQVEYRPRLGVLTVIRRECQKGVSLPPEAIAAGRRCIGMLESPAPGRKLSGPEPDDPAVLRDLKDICRLDPQQSYFVRLQKAGRHTIYGQLSWFFPDELLALWPHVIAETQALTQEFSDFTTGRSTPAWIWNEDAFIARGGVLRKEPPSSISWWPPSFGWWRAPPDSEVWTNCRGTPFHHVMSHNGAMQEFMTSAEFARLWQTAWEEEKQLPFDAACAEAVDIEAFTFAGRDSDGSLFNLIGELGGGIPSARWFDRANRCMDVIGLESFRVNAGRWIAQIQPITSPPSPTPAVRFFYELGQRIGFQREFVPGHFPRPDSEEGRRFIRQQAYREAAYHCYVQPFAAQLYRYEREYDRYWRFRPGLSDTNEGIACGLAYLLGHMGGEGGTRLLGDLLDAVLTEAHGCRSKKALGAICWALGNIGTRDAIALLGKVQRGTNDKSLLKHVDKALGAAGRTESLSADDMADRAMASHGIGPDGMRSVTISGWTARLTVQSTRKASLTTISPDGKAARGLTKVFLALPGAAAEAASLMESQQDIERILPEARRRLEKAFRNRRVWSYPFWQSHLAGNGLLRTMVSRLIWRFESAAGESFSALFSEQGLVEPDNTVRHIEGDGYKVTLWHPVHAAMAETSAWRAALIGRRIRQPFLQAWRPVYVLTDAERATATYSNRFASHVLEQAPAMAVLKAKGWKAVNRVAGGNNPDNERVILPLPSFGVAAEFWVAGIGDVMQEIPHVRQTTLYAFITTDRLAFYPLEGAKPAPSAQPLPLASITPMALSEAMMDLDAVINRTSIGNDRYWMDRGPDAPRPVSEMVNLANYRDSYVAGRSPELAAARHAFLSEMLAGLEIGNNCSLHADHLLFDGKYHSYKINLASGAIMIMPDLRYLCIVPKSAYAGESYLPSEEDPMLSLIISKAIYLSDEDQIEDATVRSQLNLPKKAR